jgi:hypothetical protein
VRILNANSQQKMHTAMAMRFWLEGAVEGNPLAQRALADELILEASVRR